MIVHTVLTQGDEHARLALALSEQEFADQLSIVDPKTLSPGRRKAYDDYVAERTPTNGGVVNARGPFGTEALLFFEKGKPELRELLDAFRGALLDRSFREVREGTPQ